MKKLKAHIFVCTNEREPGHARGCCLEKGGEKLIQKFKFEIAKAGLGKQFRAQRAGCLDTCEEGASLVVYPDGVWYGKVTEDDVTEIVSSHLKNGVPVERLKIPGK